MERDFSQFYFDTWGHDFSGFFQLSDAVLSLRVDGTSFIWHVVRSLRIRTHHMSLWRAGPLAVCFMPVLRGWTNSRSGLSQDGASFPLGKAHRQLSELVQTLFPAQSRRESMPVCDLSTNTASQDSTGEFPGRLSKDRSSLV